MLNIETFNSMGCYWQKPTYGPEKKCSGLAKNKLQGIFKNSEGWTYRLKGLKQHVNQLQCMDFIWILIQKKTEKKNNEENG